MTLFIAIFSLIILYLAYQQSTSMGHTTLIGVVFIFYCLFMELKNQSRKKKIEKEKTNEQLKIKSKKTKKRSK